MSGFAANITWSSVRHLNPTPRSHTDFRNRQELSARCKATGSRRWSFPEAFRKPRHARRARLVLKDLPWIETLRPT